MSKKEQQRLKLGNRVKYNGKEYRVFSVSKGGVVLLDDRKDDIVLSLEETSKTLDEGKMIVL